MAILATRRRCEVTSLCAACVSPCSCQLLASMNSSSLASMGNLRISERYRCSPCSGDSASVSAVDAILVFEPLLASVLSEAFEHTLEAASWLPARSLYREPYNTLLGHWGGISTDAD